MLQCLGMTNRTSDGRADVDAVEPVATITAVGVAKPSAHGHAMDRTVIAYRKASSRMISVLLAR